MSKGTANGKRIIALAYFHRYGWIAVMMIYTNSKLPQAVMLEGAVCYMIGENWQGFLG